MNVKKKLPWAVEKFGKPCYNRADFDRMALTEKEVSCQSKNN